MLVTTQAIVISSLKYAEADLIVTCVTESDGLKKYLLRGILKSKKGKLRVSYFQPLMLLDIVAQHKNKGNLEYIKEAKVLQPHSSLYTNVFKSSIVLFISEVLKNTIQEEESNPALFSFLKRSVLWLDESKEYSNFHILFLLKLSQFLGFYPDFTEDEKPYFNLMDGTLSASSENIYSETGEAVEMLKKFYDKNYEKVSSIKMNKSKRQDVLRLLINYYRLHIHGFREPKSLAVLEQLF